MCKTFEINPSVILQYHELEDSIKDYKKRMTLNRLNFEILEYARVFEGFGFYYTHSMCYRGRLYSDQNT